MHLLNNNGLLGHNRIVTPDCLTPEDRKNLDGFMLSVYELKQELKSQCTPAKPTKTGKVRKERDGKSTPNLYLDLFRRISTYENMPSPLEDVFIGAVRQHTNGSSINPYVVFALLKSLPVISTESVFVRVNQRRVKDDMMQQRYAQQLALACRNVIKVFGHYSTMIDVLQRQLESKEETLDAAFDAVADAAGYELDKVTRTEQTQEQKRNLLRQAGFDEAEIVRHESGFMIGHRNHLRVSGRFNVSLCENKTSHNTESHNSVNLEWLPSLACYVDTVTGELLEWSAQC
ncbi:TPA: hypothetical protein N3288_000209 [Klebsiella aerogenes]|nr:hypothetical protein [Klebsiella aerogenes]